MNRDTHHSGALTAVRRAVLTGVIIATFVMIDVALGSARDGVLGNAREDVAWPDTSLPLPAGMTLLEGDILTHTDAGELSARGIGLRGPTSPWPDGIVPFEIDAELPRTSADLVREAIAVWNRASGIALLPRSEVPTDLQGNHIRFQSGPGCASWVGRQGGEQPLWVGPTCSAGSIIHEIGHALGLEHEHTRADRDEHIIIHRDRIDPTKLHNFDITDFRSRQLGAYDYASIMHYGPDFFSLDGSPTMEPLVPTAITIGQRIAPSRGDLAAIAFLYGTDLSLIADTKALSRNQDAVGADIDMTLYVTNKSDQGANGLMIALQTQGMEVVGKNGDNWRCARSATHVRCRLPRLTGNAYTRFNLKLRGQPDDEGLRASLVSVTPDDDTANNAVTVMATDDGVSTGADYRPLADQDDGAAGVAVSTADSDFEELASVQAMGSTTLTSFEMAPAKQEMPTADTTSAESTVGAFTLWLPLLGSLLLRVLHPRCSRHAGPVKTCQDR